MDFRELVLKTRSYRRFDGSHVIDPAVMDDLIDLARQTPAAGNRQPLKYVISCQPKMNAAIYGTLGWAASLPDWAGPDEAERPTGYVVILHDKNVDKLSKEDVGIVAQTILLGAVSMDLGGCMFGNVRRSRLTEILGLEDHFDIALVVALGRPVERIVLEEVPPGGSATYYRDADRTHHVPKRSRAEVVVQAHIP